MRVGKVTRMRRIWMCAIGLAAVAVSTGTLAFEEQKAPTAQAPAAGTAPAGAPAAGLGDRGVAAPRVDAGTKIRVPGLGVIGEIPKMDFGLELLYGASQPRGSELQREGSGVMGRVTVPVKTPR